MKKFALITAIAAAVSAPAMAEKTPSDVLDLSCWKVTLPVSLTGGDRPTEFSEKEIAEGASNSDYFFVNEAGDGVVFRSPIAGVKTSENTKYIRSELRQMMRCGDTSISTRGINKNNWVVDTATESNQEKAGGVNGKMSVTISVDEVTTTGVDWQIGRTIIGQIHGEHDEPVKIMYRKMPHWNTGSIYLLIEPERDSGLRVHGDILLPLIGDPRPTFWRNGEKQTPKTMDHGVALGEKFSYEIDYSGNDLTVTFDIEGRDQISQTVDMRNYGYENDWFYFKAGNYIQNRTGEADEITQVTIYDLKLEH
ncbi:polysaccharide lyase family 7 protein [Photobacterium minamisatsumaniensis]|uniref:polysaccharide lyase family 7 protein n=1 Tax=Photobacterium minamisatsumaniensis TaxID=2910233 RepID=UPI003D140CAA